MVLGLGPGLCYTTELVLGLEYCMVYMYTHPLIAVSKPIPLLPPVPTFASCAASGPTLPEAPCPHQPPSTHL